MINTSFIKAPSVEESNFLQTDAIQKIQNVFGKTLKANVFITSPFGKTVTEPVLQTPYIIPGTKSGKLWKCCDANISALLATSNDSGRPLFKSCDCGHEISIIKMNLSNSSAYNLIISQLTARNGTKEKVKLFAAQNGYTTSQANEASNQVELNDYDKFVYSCTIISYQSELYSSILQSTSTLANRQNDENRTLHEEALIKAKNEAEESSRLKSSLLANMSHELRTPMTGILGFSEILHDELDDNRLKNMASTIYKSANRLMTTLNSIMDLSAIESNRTSLTLKAVNVKNTFMGLLRNAYSIASDKGLYIRTALPPHINVIADDKLLSQLLHHLIDNAIKFTIDGGISISAYSGLRDSSDVVIKISDTGIGIAPQHHKLIFEEFRQVSEGLSRTFEGSGLGLSLVMKISRLLNAKVWVESVPEKGSDFYISLPTAAVMNEEITPEIDQVEPINTIRLGRGNVPEVLIVEDNEINRRLAALYLREICNIDMAENGYIAMTKIKAKKYDAVLMDINLGAGPNGIHIAQEIRAIEHYADVPIIAVTGYTMQGDRERLLANGCSHYVAKPYDKKTLIKLFSGLLYKQPAS
jgi:signal transduction histidine kinase